MSGQAVREMVSALVGIEFGEPEQLAATLGGSLELTDENEHWSFYAVDLPVGPFVRGDYRVSRAGDRALLSLTPRSGEALSESQLDFTAWGELQNIDVNPRIPPEGTDTLIFETEGVQLRLQFTHQSRQLRTLSMRWGPAD